MKTELTNKNGPPVTPRPSLRHPEKASAAQQLLRELLDASILLSEDWQALPDAVIDALWHHTDTRGLLEHLVQLNLLTSYQASRLTGGTMFGLILGNYRVLDRLGAGGMATVYKAEHVRMRRIVAIKVLPVPREQQTQMLSRFFAEMRAIALLQHPNIVCAIDAGQTVSDDPDAPVLHYLVMEYVGGENLQNYVASRGPLPVAQACDLIAQIASALVEADKHQLIHRDIKPSNIMVTPEGQAKLLDFGLVHHFRNRLTVPHTICGTFDFISPEQGRDAARVDIRTDIYSLGGTLYWCLTHALPFAPGATLTQELLERRTKPPPSVRAVRPDVPAELDAVVQQMMATDPDDRYSTPASVLAALLPFRQGQAHGAVTVSTTAEQRPTVGTLPEQRPRSVLIVDDEKEIRDLCRFALQAEEFVCREAEGGASAVDAAWKQQFDLVLLDVDMPDISGKEVLHRLRSNPPTPNLKIIMFSGRASSDEMAQMLSMGADDYLTKPFSVVQLSARVKAAVRLKEAQDRSDLLQRHLWSVNAQLERNLAARDCDLVHARNALVLTLAELIEHRAVETRGHLQRMAYYCRCLAQEAAGLPTFAGQIDQNFIQLLECCAPLHDIGKIGLPDHILLKPGNLDSAERIIMQAHTTLGAEMLSQTAKRHGTALAFLHMAIDIVRHHHERYDGGGYPDQQAGASIPLAARIVSIADSYDTLRSRALGRPPLAHEAALQVMAESAGQFDPMLMQALQRCAVRFERLFRDLPD